MCITALVAKKEMNKGRKRRKAQGETERKCEREALKVHGTLASSARQRHILPTPSFFFFLPPYNLPIKSRGEEKKKPSTLIAYVTQSSLLLQIIHLINCIFV